ncbi:MAG: STAS domain-containing protein [Ardenticatenaceae bacterium]|nr:STAS domain-containing protein [Anaerolineales bacterium]MCB8980297.1 STAS domain-containing protein [Ardenticatenaceae bacterium]
MSSMNIWQEPLGDDIWLVAINGRLDQTLTPTLEQQLTTLLDDGKIWLVVDLSQTEYINSGGLRTLVTGWRKAKQQEGNLVLCGLNGRLQEIFHMVGFDQLFQIYSNQQAAKEALVSS